MHTNDGNEEDKEMTVNIDMDQKIDPITVLKINQIYKITTDQGVEYVGEFVTRYELQTGGYVICLLPIGGTEPEEIIFDKVVSFRRIPKPTTS